MSEEIFNEFPVDEYKDKYKVSNKGKIWSNSRKKYLNTSFSNNNEIFIIKNSKTKKLVQFRVDIIVATSFLGKSDLYLEHIDGDKKNNNILNLRWILIPDYLKSKYGCEWKEIKDFEKYFVSTDGRVWSSFCEDMIKQQITAEYYSVMIGYPKSTFNHVHKLVGMAFLENEHNYPIIIHKDGDNLNNNLSNLEWSLYPRINKSCKDKIKHDISEEPEGVTLILFPDYIITKDGKVYNKKLSRFLTNTPNGSGYYRVSINDKLHFVHKLVAMAYLPKPEEYQTQVNHKNLDRLDNRVENLEYVSPSENNKHSAENNPEQYAHLQKRVACLNKDTEEVITIYNGIKEAARISGVNSGSIVKVCKGTRPTAGNYKWKYV